MGACEWSLPRRGAPPQPVPHDDDPLLIAAAARLPDAVLLRPDAAPPLAAAVPPGVVPRRLSAALRPDAAIRPDAALRRPAAALPPGVGAPPGARPRPAAAPPPVAARVRRAPVPLPRAAVRGRAPVLPHAVRQPTRRRWSPSASALRDVAGRRGAPCRSAAWHRRAVLPRVPAAPAAADAAARGRVPALRQSSRVPHRSAAAGSGLAASRRSCRSRVR